MSRNRKKEQQSPRVSRTQRRGSGVGMRAASSRNTPGQNARTSRKQTPVVSPSRASGVERYTTLHKKEKKKKGLYTVLTIFLVILLSGIGFGAWYLKNLSDQLGAGVDDTLRATLTQTEAGKPFYMLLLGTDASKERRESAEFGKDAGNYRTDSIILARIDPGAPKVTLVSIHRDTLVNMGDHGQQKINSAYSFGGAAYTTEVVSDFAGVPISHYAEVDFDGLISIIDDIGGVEINLPRTIDDDMAGGRVEAGKQTINGEQALIICRSRHSYDDCGDGDSYRAANQRMVISAIIKKILTLDPISMAGAISKCTSYVTTDLDATTILSLAGQMKDLDTSKDIYSGMDPTIHRYVNNTWYEICDTAAWQKMMSRVNQGLPPYESKSDDPTRGIAGSVDGSDGSEESNDDAKFTGTVLALNSTDTQGLAAKIASKLKEAGFDAMADNAASEKQTTTQIIYNKGGKESANGVKSTLKAGEVVANDGSHPKNTDVVIIIGTDLAK